MEFRFSQTQDLQQIMILIAQAQAYFKEQGVDQWQNGYPDEACILNDIANGYSYVLFSGDQLIATAMISFDGEPTYTHITGAWRSNAPYAVVHRIAVERSMKGQNVAGLIFERVVELCKQRDVTAIRIDTHPHNLNMTRVIEKQDFVFCGTIRVADGTARNAYEKIIK